MYIDFLNESPLWYWYHSGGVIAGLVVTVVLGAIIFGQSNWKTGGILLKTIMGSAFMTVMPLGLARLGFSMAIGNAELVGYLSIGGTAVALTVGIAYLIGKGSSKSNQPSLVSSPASLPNTDSIPTTVPERNKRMEDILNNLPKDAKGENTVNEPKPNPVPDTGIIVGVPVPTVPPVEEDITEMGYQKASRIGWLTVNNGDNAGDIFYLQEGSNSVGRNSHNQICVGDVYLSGEQCDIKVQDNKITLFDLGSSSGTKINGSAFNGKTINLGSTITLGDTKLKVLKIDSPEEFDSVSNLDNTVIETAAKKAVVLVAVSGPDTGKSYLLQEGLNKIGRSSDSDIRLNDKSVSRKHAAIKCQDGTFTLFNVGSSTKTEIDGVKVSGIELRGNEEINAGRTQFKFTAAAA